MAPKKTNRMPTGEKAKQLSGLASRTARDVGSAAEGAAIAGRNRDFAKKEAAKAAAKKASYSPKPMGLYEQGQTSRAAAKKQADKVTAKRLKATSYAPTPMTDKQKKAAALKGAKKQAGISIKKDVKKITGAAGKAAGFATKAAMAPSNAIIKGAKAIAKEVRGPKRQVGKSGTTIKQLMNNKNLKKK
jgi:hypothetical protein